MTHNYTQHIHTNMKKHTIADSFLYSLRVRVLYFGRHVEPSKPQLWFDAHSHTYSKSGTATGKLFQPRHHSISRVQLRTGKHDRQPVDMMAAITPFHLTCKRLRFTHFNVSK